MAVLIFTGCRKKETIAPELSASATELSFVAEGGTGDLTITGNATWSINNPASWLQLSKATGSTGSTAIKLTTAVNTTGATRSVVLTVSSTNGLARRITISQANLIFPSYTTSPKAPDQSGMSSTAVQLAAKIGLGVNIGNTMEAPNITELGEFEETWGWGNIEPTESYIKFLKQTGFNAVRIPCSWVKGYVKDPKTMKIDAAWLSRVHQLVKYCVDNDVYVLLNIHWDGGWLDDNIKAAKKDSVIAKQKALWEQIATKMRDFDEHLMFASANEPPADTQEEMDILNSYHETFVKAVRATGGRNSYRVLVVQGPNTSADWTYRLMNTLPHDPVPNRMMVEVHEYTPSQFCILDDIVSWGRPVFYWGAGNHSTIEPEANATYGEEDAILDSFRKLKEKFTSKGIPVVLGEYATMRRNASNKYVPKDMAKHNKSVDDWTTFVTKQCKLNGVLPFYWEVGNVLDRRNEVVKDQAMINALKEGMK